MLVFAKKADLLKVLQHDQQRLPLVDAAKELLIAYANVSIFACERVLCLATPGMDEFLWHFYISSEKCK